jgi:hypothetical protein
MGIALDWLVLGAAGLASLAGLGLGLVGLFSPAAAAKIVRLQADPAFPDGMAEFRASFGGLFIGVHGMALAFLALTQTDQGHEMAAIFACSSAAALWLGTALGRAFALAVDRRTRTAYQAFAVGFETALGAMLLGPMAAFWLV